MGQPWQVLDEHLAGCLVTDPSGGCAYYSDQGSPANAGASRTLTGLRDILLPRLMSGEIHLCIVQWKMSLNGRRISNGG